MVIVYTYCQDMFSDMITGQVPATISEFELIANHYQISSIWMGMYAFCEVQKGCMKWEEWLPDGLHPEYRGSFSYAQSVIGFLQNELAGYFDDRQTNSEEGAYSPSEKHVEISKIIGIPNPLSPTNWEYTTVLPFSRINFQGPWKLRRWSSMPWADQVLETAAVGAELNISFYGKGIALGFDFGLYSSEFRYRIDGGEWIDSDRERPSWCPDTGWYRISTLADSLLLGNHTLELIVTHGNCDDCKGTNFRLALVGVLSDEAHYSRQIGSE